MELVLKSKFTCPTFVPHTNPHGIAKPSIESHPQIYPLIHTLSNDSFNSKNSEVDSVEENEEKFEERFYQDFPSLEMDPTLKICSQPVVFQLSHSPSSLTFHYVYVEKKKRQLLWETSPLDPPIYLSFSHRILHALFCTLHEPCLFVAFSSMAKCYSVKTKESTWLHLPFVPWIIKPLTKGLLIQPAKPLSLSSDTSFYQQLFFIEHPLDQILPVPVNLAAVTCSDFSSFSPSTTKHNSTPPLQPSLMQLNPNEHLVFTHRHLVVLASPTQLSLYKLMPNPHATLTSHAHPSTSPLWTSSLSSSPVERKTHLPNRSFSPFDTSPLGRTPSPWPTTSLNAPPSIKEPSSSVHPSAFSSTTTTSTSSSSPSMRFAKKKLQPITTLLIPPSYQFHSMYACSDIRSNSLQYAILYSDASMGFHLHILSYAPQTCQVTHVLTFTEKVIQVVSVSWQDHPCLLIHRLDHSLHLWIGFLPSLPITVSETLSSLAWTHPATSLVVVATKANPDHLIHANLELPRWKPKPLIQMMHVLAYGLPEKEYWALVFHPPSPSSSSLADLLLQTHFPHSVLAVLSILYQEWKLNILLKSHLTQLAHVLTCLSAQLGWANYTDYFTLQFPERTRTFPLRLDASLDHPVAHVDPSHWLKLLHSKLTSQASVVHPTLSEIQDNFRIENNFTKHLNEHQLLPRTSTVCRFLDLFDATNPSPSSPEYLTIVKFLYDRYPVKSSFDSWPWYWQAIFLGFLDQAKENISAAPLRSDLALYIDRPELMPSSELSKLSLPIRERSPRLQGTTLHSLTHLTSLTQPFTHPFPQVDTPLMDAISLLELPSTPVYLDYLVVKGDALDTMTPETLKQEKRKAVEWYASKILASHFGRAAFHYHTQPFPSLSTHWTLPTLPSLSVVFPSTGHPQDSSAPVSFDPPLHATDWPEFHFGVATALSYQPGPFDEAWLWLHRPKQLTATFGGLLMGLGFIGQFKTLTPLLSLYLMRRSHVFVDMGYLLGLSIANRGSMDEILLRLVTLHTTDMDYPDPQDHPLRPNQPDFCLYFFTPIANVS
ncbi:Anaphase-promoting complex subunit 1 [Coelomomyces lativittatus]|nr:Anaphase-promoting complex subunit 1 [Coelomomyces lativittatus]